jgi:hypothetical protein
MARPKFKIDDGDKLSFCQKWISNQFHKKVLFPCFDPEVISSSKKAFETISYGNYGELNDWSEKYLDSSQWQKMKGALRARRHKIENYGETKRVDMDEVAHRMLKDLSKHHGVTLSKVIRIYLEKPWLKIPTE